MSPYKYANLSEAITDNEYLGSQVAATGRAKVPEGYAIMLNPDGTHYYWISASGYEGPIDWNKWRVLREAKAHAETSRVKP